MNKDSNIVINVIGHTNPDTDSLCSAIAYAYLKRKVTGGHYVAKRAGQINAESKFVLDYFQAEIPDYLGDVRTQVMDIDVNRVKGVTENISIKAAWKVMQEGGWQTLPVVSNSGRLKGLLTIEDIAKSYMDIYDSRVISNSRTPFQNIEIGRAHV